MAQGYNFGGNPDHASDPGVQSPKSGSSGLLKKLQMDLCHAVFGGGLCSLSVSSCNCNHTLHSQYTCPLLDKTITHLMRFKSTNLTGNFVCFIRAAISAPSAWLSCSSHLNARVVSLLDVL